MLASASAPCAPHLLSNPLQPHPDLMSHPNANGAGAGPSRAALASPTGTRGLRGFFSRARSPESGHESGRSRWRSGEAHSGSGAAPGAQPLGSLWDAQGKLLPHPQRTQRTSDGKRHRPPSPGQTRRNIRFAPSALPAMQKGEDGKWQPPSLSRGSLSTSALALYARDEVDDPMNGREQDEVQVDVKEKKGRHGLTLLFQSGRFGSKAALVPSPPPEPVSVSVSVSVQQTTMEAHARDRTARPTARSGDRTARQSMEPIGAVTPRSRSPVKDAFNHTPRQQDYLPSSSRYTPPVPAHPPTRPSPGSTHRRARSNPPVLPLASDPTGPRPNPAFPTHARAETELPPLSKEHYLLRLSASYLVKCLVPIIRGSGFVNNDKNNEVRRIADERLRLLERMERNWGGEWMKAATAALAGEENEGEAREVQVRAVGVGMRQKERERRTWADALRDGVLLCFLFNHLMPCQPPHIARVNISEDGIIRATNITRVVTACQTIGMPSIDVFVVTDMQTTAEDGLARVARTILALARRSNRGFAPRSRSPTAGQSPSRVASRSASPMGSPAVSPTGSPRRTNVALPSSRRASREIPISADEANSLHAKLQAAISADVTPPSSTFRRHPTPTTPVRPPTLGRAATVQSTTPVRAHSPPSTPSRPGTPTRASLSTRPSLRPRHTTSAGPAGSRVAFVAGPPSPRSAVPCDRQAQTQALHARERTPSLISSNSRITSAYTRTSTALSIGTVVGEYDTDAVDLAEEEEDDSRLRARSWERRESEQTLHNARQKILGTLLSSEDLPLDLRGAIQRESAMEVDDARGHAISQSLAALEGRPSPASSAPSTPSRRPAMRRPHTVQHGPVHDHVTHGHVQVDRLSEADEAVSTSSGPGSGFSQAHGARPSAIRRVSASGKIYVPKQRSSSPTDKSPTSPAIPMAPTPFPSLAGQDAGAELQRRGSRVRRRQSEAQPSSQSSIYPSGQSKQGSAVHLPSSGAPSLFREGSSQSVIRNGPGQTLVFDEPGCAPVRYQLGNCVGRGQFGSVYRSLNLGTGQMVAIKRIRLHGMKETEVRDVMKEVELLKSLDHPSIVKYQGMSRDEEYLNIVLEFVENGSLGQTIKSFGMLNERLVATYVAKILEGLDYLHSQGVVHCDLKAANILSTKTGNVKLSDFGVSLNMKAVENIKHDAQTSGKRGPNIGDVAGTPNWMAPEVISLNGASPASDIWSLGCTVIELLTGKPPYHEITNSMSVLFRIVEDEMPPLPDVSEQLQDFLKLCFIKDPRFRPSAATLFEHIWVRLSNPELQMLRPQDSVPFLRRVSMNSSRANSTRLFANDGMPDHRSSRAMSIDDLTEGMRSKRTSYASFHDVLGHPREGSGSGSGEAPVKPHAFIKTSFGQAIICRICHVNVKKVGVLCQGCGLIAHASCATNSTTRCDPHEQVVMHARQQEFLQSSRPVSRKTSQEGLEPNYLRDLPGRILSGLKRSTTGLRSPTPEPVDGERRRRMSGRGKSSLPPGAAAAADAVPSPAHLQTQTLQPTRPALESRHRDSSQSRISRISMLSNASGVGSTEDVRRRSAIRFDLDEINGEGLEGWRGKETKVRMAEAPLSPRAGAGPAHHPGVTVLTAAKLGAVHGGQHGKRDSKSDCCVQ